MDQRIIKFRVFDKEQKTMHFQDLGAFVGVEKMQIHPIKCILMQFTGEKTKSNKEIFEGDILKGRVVSAIYRVDFEKGKFVLNHLLKYLPNRWGDLSRLFDKDMIEFYNDVDIVGNVYENSDLL